MKIFYDKEKIIEDLDFESLLSDLNIPTKRKGRYLYALCPKHNDDNFGSAYVLQGMYKGSQRKGIYCYACNKYISAISLVEDSYGLSYTDALELLANKNSMTPDDYISDIMFSSKEEEDSYYSKDKDKAMKPKKKVAQKKAKAIISRDELRFLDLAPEESEHNDRDYGYLGHHYNILDVQNYRPDDKISYIEHSYWDNNESVIRAEYLIFEKSKEKFDIDELFSSDIEAYKFLILSKAYNKKDCIERLLNKVKYATSEELVLLRDVLKLDLTKVNRIIETHQGLSADTFNNTDVA